MTLVCTWSIFSDAKQVLQSLETKYLLANNKSCYDNYTLQHKPYVVILKALSHAIRHINGQNIKSSWTKIYDLSRCRRKLVGKGKSMGDNWTNKCFPLSWHYITQLKKSFIARRRSQTLLREACTQGSNASPNSCTRISWVKSSSK